MGCTLDELGKRMSAAERALRYEDYLEEPWDLRIISEQLAMIHTLLVNVHRNTRDHPEPFTFEDFVPGNQPRPEPVIETRAERSMRIQEKLRKAVPRNPKRIKKANVK